MTDLTEIQRLDKALAESKEEARKLKRALAASVYVIDAAVALIGSDAFQKAGIEHIARESIEEAHSAAGYKVEHGYLDALFGGWLDEYRKRMKALKETK